MCLCTYNFKSYLYPSWEQIRVLKLQLLVEIIVFLTGWICTLSDLNASSKCEDTWIKQSQYGLNICLMISVYKIKVVPL